MRKMTWAADPRFPAIYLEALAYHEAGHAVMAVLLNLRIETVVIGPRCTHNDFNGWVNLGPASAALMISRNKLALLEVASEPAEKLAPSYDQFGSMHKVYRHLKPFKLGVRNDLARGF